MNRVSKQAGWGLIDNDEYSIYIYIDGCQIEPKHLYINNLLF